MAFSKDFIDTVDCDLDFLDCIEAGDESWFYEYDSSIKHQTSERVGKNSPGSSKVQSVISEIKTMSTVFFYACGIIQYEFVPLQQALNAAFYESVMEHLPKIHIVRSQFHKSSNWFLLHDNAPYNFSILLKQYPAEWKVVSNNHPLNSRDLTVPDYFLFPKRKIPTKGYRFSSVEEIQIRAIDVFKIIPKEELSCAFS